MKVQTMEHLASLTAEHLTGIDHAVVDAVVTMTQLVCEALGLWLVSVQFEIHQPTETQQALSSQFETH